MPATAQGPETGLDRLFAALHAAPVRRVRQGKVIAGTAAGLARYFGVDPIVVRVAFVIIAVISGMGITAYLIAWLLLPDDEDTVLLQRAIRDHSGGAITLAVFAVLSFFSADDNGGWAKSVFTTAVLVAAGVFFWRRHARRTGGSAPPPPVSPASAPPAPPTPGAAAHGSPTRGGLSRFDPVTGRWIPAAADPASGPTPPPPVPSQGSSSVAGAGLPVDRVEAPDHPMPTTAGPGRAAMWAPPGSPSVSAGAGAAEAEGFDARRAPRPRMAWWASSIVLLLAAGAGVGAGWSSSTLAPHAGPAVVVAAAALLVVAVALLVAGIRGRSARPLVIAALLLIPAAIGVVGFEVAGPLNAHFQLIFGSP